MKTPKLYLILVSICLAIVAIIAGDNYLFPRSSHEETLDNGTTDISSRKSGRHVAYYFLTKEGGKYQVSSSLYNHILIGEQIRIERATIFRKPVRLGWYREGRYYSMPISAINGSYTGDVIIIALLIFGLLVLTGILKVDTARRRTWVYLYCMATAGTLLFYLTY